MIEVIDRGSTSESHPVPLLFVHGASSAAWCWDEHFLGYFADRGYRAVALSLRGHGASSLPKPLDSCSIADYADDVHTVAGELGVHPVLIGHSMGSWVVLNYLATHGAPAAVLMAPGTPQGMRRWALRLLLRHPWLVLRTNTFGNPADLFGTPALACEFVFSAGTPESVVASCLARMGLESKRASRETVKQLPSARAITMPMLVLGAGADGMRVAGDASAVAGIYQADLELFPGMGHIMMLGPGWQVVAEKIDSWLTAAVGTAMPM
ncbi:alpha/beta hydrolase [Mycolicibacterium porcinum]|uniref:Alpha/beta fold hydrolase n=1 Tax=Mycolicibacterium porcinum TaxID=39693 RepID=A0AAW5T086_9MYCO|nr:alpha/beta fold hydrolase [Mycolicibacterium porcinum]MCV7388240.1 alpha/beta fold hydrolase [Mycolicibacterium porcinum]CDO32287.1 alpha/beta hydrolase fold protein [Mycolicibacterium vulneris]